MRERDNITIERESGPPPGTVEERDYKIRRRTALLVALLSGLAITLIALPSETRRRLITGFFENRLLVNLLVLFALLSLSLLWSAGQRLDALVFLFINRRGIHLPWLDRVMLGITQIGNGLTAFVLATGFYIAGLRRIAVVMILGTLSLWLVVETIKLLTFRSRPFFVFSETQVIGWRERGRSFPSGHTSQTFFLIVVLVDFFEPAVPITVLMYFLALIVALSRVYIGVHYPRDVMAGAILGSVWGILGTLIQNYLMGGPV
ncbi:MAG TPA: phosphatase PAP2 family protein [Anaerolineaceae bacterium]|nr:phosphatase PAP2 family protein [Anaerolineaceae bacterium]